MRYRIKFDPRASGEFLDLPAQAYQAVARTIDRLEEVSRPPGVRKLRGGDLWRIRAGDYRIVYQVNDVSSEIVIVRVAHRREAYRRL